MEQNMDKIKNAWIEEYKRRGIPSSFRKDPTKPVIEFVAWLKNKGHRVEGTAVDVGCGLGRNSFYLASEGFQVIGIELIEENVRLINEQAQSNRLTVHAIAQDAATSWSITQNSVDIAIDVFCYKHIVCKEKQKIYRQELAKALKSDGFYFISLASENDGFYGPLLKGSPDPKEKLIIDPYSGIASFLYSIDDLREEFSDLFELVEAKEQSSTSPMYGKEYQRKVLNFIFKKKEILKLS